MLQQHWRLVDETLGEADGVYIVDGSDVPKQGEHSVGVARQWCGHVGKVDNCQAGVFAAYASRKGYTLLDRRLYLPDEWFDAAHRERWQQVWHPARRPASRPSRPWPWRCCRRWWRRATLRFRWVTCDEAFGRDAAFLDGVAALAAVVLCRSAPRHAGLADPASDGRAGLVGPGPPAPQGPPGPRGTCAAAGRSARRGRPPGRVAALPDQRGQQRAPGGRVRLSNAGWRYARVCLAQTCGSSFGGRWGRTRSSRSISAMRPAHTPVAALVRVAGMRWPIETAFEESKGGLGLDHYEVRSWLGWHHHMTLCLLAHHFLVRARLRVKKGRRR